MKSVYFVRHGQTVWNVENKICGATDIELTALGHEQAIETGKKILEKKIEADVILYSPLVRAKDKSSQGHDYALRAVELRRDGRGRRCGQDLSTHGVPLEGGARTSRAGRKNGFLRPRHPPVRV